MTTRKTSKTAPQEPPLLAGRLDQTHLDRLYRWLATSPTAAQRRRAQADLLAWSKAQRGLEAAAGLEGLWRTTEVIRTSSQIAIDRPDYDDIEGIEAADAPTLDDQSRWSDACERLFYFLEIRGSVFRELDLSVYPVVHETHTFDADELDYVAESAETDAIAGSMYDDWFWAITRDEEGFIEIAEYATSPRRARGGRRWPPKWASRADKAEILLNYHDADEHVIDRIRLVSKNVLERRVFLLADGVYTFSCRCRYERFAAPLAGSGEGVPVQAKAAKKAVAAGAAKKGTKTEKAAKKAVGETAKKVKAAPKKSAAKGVKKFAKATLKKAAPKKSAKKGVKKGVKKVAKATPKKVAKANATAAKTAGPETRPRPRS